MPEKPAPDNFNTILIFTDWYVPGHRAGGPIQSVYNLANVLCRQHTVRVVCRDRDLNAAEPYAGIVCNVWTELADRHFVMYLDREGSKFNSIKQLIKLNQVPKISQNRCYAFGFFFTTILIN